MGISIKHDEYERLIRQLAENRGMSLTEAIGVAVRNEIERGAKTIAREGFMERVRLAQMMVRAGPILDDRPYRDILYDDSGLPR